MRLQDQGDALDRGSIGAFAALRETLLDEPLRFGEQGDSLAWGAFAAEIILEALAIGRLRKHTR
jgi:hypothetical protein